MLLVSCCCCQLLTCNCSSQETQTPLKEIQIKNKKIAYLTNSSYMLISLICVVFNVGKNLSFIQDLVFKLLNHYISPHGYSNSEFKGKMIIVSN